MNHDHVHTLKKGEVHSLRRWGLILRAESDDLETIPLSLFINYVFFFANHKSILVRTQYPAKRPKTTTYHVPRRHFPVSRNVLSDANFYHKTNRFLKKNLVAQLVELRIFTSLDSCIAAEGIKFA
jgi:hypothetical protein